MTRRRKVLLGVAIGVVAAGAAVLWALPEIVRRAAVERIPAVLHRAVAIEDVDLNLFTGRFAVKRLRLADRDGPAPFVELERLDGQVSYLSLVRSDIRLTLSLTAPTVRVVRTGESEFNFSDLLALFKTDPSRPPSRWTVSLDRLQVTGGAVLAVDRHLSPPEDWRLDGLQVDAAGLSTRPGASPGRLHVDARLGGASLGLRSDAVRLAPVALAAHVTLAGFDLARVRRYVPPELPLAPAGGILGVSLTVAWERTAEAIKKAQVAGEIRLDRLSVEQREAATPFLTVGRLAVALKEVDLVARAATVASIEVEGLDLRVGRSRTGEIDLLKALRDRGADASAPSAAPAPATGAAAAPAAHHRLRVKQLALGRARIAFLDEAVMPPRDWRVEELSVKATDLSLWPGDGPGTVALRARVGAGAASRASVAIDAEAVSLVPASARLRASVQGFDLPEVVPYLPGRVAVVPARGRLEADVTAEVGQGATGLERAQGAGRVQVRDLTLARRGGEPVVTVSRLATRVRSADLLARSVSLGRVAVGGVDLRLRRDAQGKIDLVEAITGAGESAGSGAPADAPAGPSAPEAPAPPAFKTRLERLTLRSGTVTLTDETLSPPREWRVEGLTVDAGGLSLVPGEPPGSLQVKAQVSSRPGPGHPATLSVALDALRAEPLLASGRIGLDGLDLTTLLPYVREGLPAALSKGMLTLELTTAVEEGRTEMARANVAGTVRLTDIAVTHRGADTPFIVAPRVTVSLKQVDGLARALTVGAIEIERPQARVVRGADGRIDVLGLTAGLPAGPSAAPAAAPAAPAPAGPRRLIVEAITRAVAMPWKVRLDRFAIAKGGAVFEDHAVSPVTTLPVSDVMLTAESITWPAAAPGTLDLTAGLPGGGLFLVKGTATVDPLDVKVAISTLNAPIEPYQAYFPFSARFSGLFSGDSRSEVKMQDGALVAASRGSAWVKDFQVRAPGSPKPLVELARMSIRGIDFAWPNYALVDRITISRPEALVERAPDGRIELRAIFQTASPPAGSPPPAPPAAASAPRPAKPGLLQTMVIDFNEITVEEGYLRFLDRTTQPAFSQDLSHLALAIHGLSNAPGRRTTLTAQAIVGGDAALDLRGELSRLGEDLYADLVGQLNGLDLTAMTPYTTSLLSWQIQTGKLQARVHYRLERDQLTGEHEVKVDNLKVAPGSTADDAVKERIGLPLGLIVALLKDTHGGITLDLPVTGSLSDRRFNWGEAIWAAAKQVIVKVLAAPFRAIGRLFTGGEGDKVEALHVDPVTFAAGSPVVGPAAEGHLKRVADFLRASPFVHLTLVAVTTKRDVDSIKAQEVSARVQRLQRERGIADFAEAVRAYFIAQLPAVTPPRTAREQLALLREREPMPETAIRELAGRRLEATREALARVESIAAERLRPGSPRADLEGAGDGRVEFGITAE